MIQPTKSLGKLKIGSHWIFHKVLIEMFSIQFSLTCFHANCLFDLVVIATKGLKTKAKLFRNFNWEVWKSFFFFFFDSDKLEP